MTECEKLGDANAPPLRRQLFGMMATRQGVRDVHRAFRYAARLSEDGEFFKFQNDLARTAYEVLGLGYKTNDNEVALVTKLVNAVDGKTYDRIHMAASKFHGSRSFVEFDYRDKPTTKELGDMAVISVVTSGSERLLQRVCIIQNKKAKDDRWSVDPEQLFLLKNFPPFSGNRGLFRGLHDVTFRNRSGCLGAYGLFLAPGEMMFLAAPLLAEMLRDRAALAPIDIGMPLGAGHGVAQAGLHAALLPGGLIDPDEWHMIMRDVFRRGRLPWMGFGLPFLGNVHQGRDIYDFVRAWTQINLGEYTYAGGAAINPDLDAFANRLVLSAGLDSEVDHPTGNQDSPLEGDIAVFLLRMDLEGKAG